MKRSMMRLLVVTAVVGILAVGYGLRANAETPASDTQKVKSQFVCAHVTDVAKPQSVLNDQCDPTKVLATTFVPGPPGIVYCCVRK